MTGAYVRDVEKTSVQVPRRIYRLLEALRKAREFQGVRPSASAVVASLVEQEAARRKTERERA